MENVKITKGDLVITFTAAGGLDGYAGFGDQWKMVDDHKGGVTIKNPNPYREAYPYAIPQQTTLAELASDFHKQGRDNPSREAYESLQAQLERDIEASDYYIDASVKHTPSGRVILDGFTVGPCFDHSIHDDETLEAALLDVVTEYDLADEVLEEVARLKEVFKNV